MKFLCLSDLHNDLRITKKIIELDFDNHIALLAKKLGK